MARAILRAGAYLPAYTDGVRRLGAADEDALTYASAALERAARTGPELKPPVTVHPLGTVATLDAGTFAALLGTEVSLETVGPGTSAVELFRAAQRGSGPHWLVVSAGGGRASERSVLSAPGEGAVALLIDEAPDARGSDPEALAPASHASADALASWFEFAERAGNASWSGDWTADPTRGAVSSHSSAPDVAAGSLVSQGAFVPGPRYDESRRSRWRFEADRCGRCGQRTFPARGRCRSCGATEALQHERLPLGGWTVVASTVIGRGGQPTEFDAQVEATGPYGVVLAELATDARVTLQVAPELTSPPAVGSRVDTGLRRLYSIEGAWRYGRKAVPLEGSPAAPSRGRG